MSFLRKLDAAVNYIADGIKSQQGEGHQTGQYSSETHTTTNRFDSFAPRREGNNIKWFVDGCGYFHAVSEALEQAQHSIWILDWWLSPELYLRRPPSENEQYRLDRMILAAAERGVKVNIIVYKEVTQALTRKYLNPTLPDYLHSLVPTSTDNTLRGLARFGFHAVFKTLEYVEATYPLISSPISVSSAHTKHALEDLHPNIAVFRHPDHLPDREALESSFTSSIKNMKLTAANASKLPEEALRAIYGVTKDTVLYWAHHEKLCIVDSTIAFMGGLDLCYGRWDTNQHSIADAHPGDLKQIVFPGQDYNNARIMDFQDVGHWQANKLDRRTNSRMGWSDVSVSLSGPVVDDLRAHFAQRWDFIYDEKYQSREDSRYARLAVPIHHLYAGGHEHYRHHGQGLQGVKEEAKDRLHDGLQILETGRIHDHTQPTQASTGNITLQILRSCSKWSHGVPLEKSIQEAYIEVITRSQHFVYIENQFFITATCDKQKPVRNRIGAAIVERIIRAVRAGEKYKVVVVIPAIPAFAGDLRADDALSTRAIMDFQYKSINRGEYSIMQSLEKEGIDASHYIRFYNLRNYDRINTSATMKKVEENSNVSYEDARKQHDDQVGAGFNGSGEGTGATLGHADLFNQYQRAAEQEQGSGNMGKVWDSVASCYMLNGEDIRNVPWEDGNTAEIDAFVSEELYIHTKLLIADDQVVICGSANLNDRSQLGDHDSEIAIFVEDTGGVESMMNGRPWRASKFAASLRRQLFRKHLGLLRPQDMRRPDQNFCPIGVPNTYDWGSQEDKTVMDPLSEDFLEMWDHRATINTDAFGKVFHPVPYDGVRNWDQYTQYYERFFHEDTKAAEKASLHKWGHVVAEQFPAGEEGLTQVKEILSTIKGNLVHMPLHFLEDVDLAKEGLSYNPLTEEVYT